MLAIDHFVFPVPSLEGIKAPMQRLGFTLAPQAEHPFGTANICLFLASNVYIEFLSLNDEALYAQAMKDDVPFIRDVGSWRKRNGYEGFAGLAFASQDAYADQTRFENLGISAGRIGEFSREFALPDGTTDIASFRTAHTHLPSMTEILCFTCQRVRVPTVDRRQVESHNNGVEGLKKIIIAAPKPLELRQTLTKLLDGPPSLAVPDALGFKLPNVELVALSPDALMQAYGLNIKTQVPRLVGLIFSCQSLSAFEKHLASQNVSHHKRQDMILHHLFDNDQIFWGFSQS